MIEFKNVSKHFGPTQVLHNIDLNIAQGEVVVIIGPSGSGKSTLLRCINKLEEITACCGKRILVHSYRTVIDIVRGNTKTRTLFILCNEY